METLFDFSPLILAIVPVILGLVEAIKALGLQTKYAPLVSIVLGVALVSLTGVSWQALIAQGIIAGLAASGLWSSGKKIIQG